MFIFLCIICVLWLSSVGLDYSVCFRVYPLTWCFSYNCEFPFFIIGLKNWNFNQFLTLRWTRCGICRVSKFHCDKAVGLDSHQTSWVSYVLLKAFCRTAIITWLCLHLVNILLRKCEPWMAQWTKLTCHTGALSICYLCSGDECHGTQCYSLTTVWLPLLMVNWHQ